MRAVLWLLFLFAVAVVAAATLGTNDGLVSLYWRGWRTDLSLNLFLVLLGATCLLLMLVLRGALGLLDLPTRAHEWRQARRERTAQRALHDALAFYFSGRYSRAQKAARRALGVRQAAPELDPDRQFSVLALVLAAGSSHRLQDRAARDAALRDAFELAGGGSEAAQEGARLLAAEWALDDRNADRALQLVGELPQGVARRTHALRLKLQAARLGRQPLEALKTARLLAKHQAFTPAAAEGLLRTLAFEALDTARDVDQLRRVWLQLDNVDRRDALVAARAVSRAADLGAVDEARGWLRPFWDRLSGLSADERAALAQALTRATPGIGGEWLARLESAAAAFPREGAIALAVGSALAERQLWGKARALLEAAATDAALAVRWRRDAWLKLAHLARQAGDNERAADCFESAARLGD
jgi:HemY protein